MTDKNRFRAVLIGEGRLGRPFCKYLSSLEGWSVEVLKSADNVSDDIDYVFLAVPDQQIGSLIKKIPNNTQVVHFSGSLYFESAIGVHPVYSFSNTENVKVDFKNLDFVIDRASLSTELSKVFINTYFIAPENKKIYHTYL